MGCEAYLELILFYWITTGNYGILSYVLFLVSFYFASCLHTADSRRILNEEEVENLLIFLLSQSSLRVQVAAAQAVASVAENLVSRDAFGKLGCNFLIFSLFIAIKCAIW